MTQLRKYGHSCVRFEDGDRALLIDPGVFSDVDAALDGAQEVLITHGHADHVDADRLRAAARADSRLRIFAPEPVAATLNLGEQVVPVEPGETFQAAGFEVRTFGGQHALIHPLIPVVANVAYLVDGTVYHPGDSLVVPAEPVATLLLPSMAPWARVADLIDFAVAVRAPRAYPIHDVLVKPDLYTAILQTNLVPVLARYEIEFASWDGSVTA